MQGSSRTTKRYSAAAITLHWAIAALLVFQVSLGWRLEDLPRGVAQFQGYQLHKSVGITILLLSVARLLVRLTVRRPAHVAGPPAMRLLVSAVHAGLYGVMVLGPLTGWIIVSTSKIKFKTMLFGVVPWPSLPLGSNWHDPAAGLHSVLGWVAVGLFVLHVAGALRHHFAGEDIVGRMIPTITRRGLNIGLAVVGLGFLAALIGAKVWPFGAAAPVASAPATAEAPLPASEATAETASEAAAEPAEEPSASPSEEAALADTAATPWAVAKGGHLGFTIDYSGSPITGSFARWKAAIKFGPEDLEHSSVRVTIDLGSVASGDAQRDDMLKGENFFAVAAHPEAVFTSTRITRKGEGRYAAAGTLALNGHSQPLTLAFSLAIDGDRAKANGSAALKRSAFGVGTGEWSSTDELKDPVTVNFALTAQRQP